jgi:hypothetical protein
MGETRNAYKILVGKYEQKRPFGRRRLGWKNDSKIDCKEIAWEVVFCDEYIYWVCSLCLAHRWKHSQSCFSYFYFSYSIRHFQICLFFQYIKGIIA